MPNNTDNLGSTAWQPIGRLNRKEKEATGRQVTPNCWWWGENIKEENPNKEGVGVTGRRKAQGKEENKIVDQK